MFCESAGIHLSNFFYIYLLGAHEWYAKYNEVPWQGKAEQQQNKISPNLACTIMGA